MTIVGVVLVALGLALLGAIVVRVWSGMVRYAPPDAPSRTDMRNREAARLYEASRPVVSRVLYDRRRKNGPTLDQ